MLVRYLVFLFFPTLGFEFQYSYCGDLASAEWVKQRLELSGFSPEYIDIRKVEPFMLEFEEDDE